MPIRHVQSLSFNFRLSTAFVLKLWSALGYPRKMGWGLRTWNFLEVLKEEHVEVPGSIKKEVEFPAVIKKKSCGISIGLGFSPWNFQGVPHNFVKYSKVKLCFL